jgi:hypothetical protein
MQKVSTDDLSTPTPRYSWPSRVAFGALAGFAHFSALSPLILYGLLFVASWRAEALIGHWPVAWVDDPWYSIPDDRLYSFLLGTVNVFFGAALMSLFAAPVFAILLVSSRPKHLGVWVWVAFLMISFAAGLLLMSEDPAARMQWIVG